MKTNVTLLARNRHRLTNQTLESIFRHTTWDGSADVTVLDDASEPPIEKTFPLYLVRNDVATGGAGIARNQVIRAVESSGRKGDLLYCGDNDCWHTPGWLDILTDLWPHAYRLGFRVLGGWSHSYNAQAVNIYPAYSESARRTIELRECLAVATQSWLMDWETWSTFGPFDEAPGVRQSEDVAFCNRVRAAGFKVGYTFPYCVYSTSKTDTFGQQVPGAETIVAPEGVLIL